MENTSDNMENRAEQLHIAIELATIGDLESIQRLNQELCAKENREFDTTIDPDYPLTEKGKEYFTDKIESPDALVLISKEGGIAVGYLIGAMAASEDYRKEGITIAELENMYVSESMRGKGIGGKLVEEFETWCNQRGVQIIRIVASAGNEGAIKFYEKFGAKPASLTLEKKLSAE